MESVVVKTELVGIGPVVVQAANNRRAFGYICHGPAEMTHLKIIVALLANSSRAKAEVEWSGGVLPKDVQRGVRWKWMRC